jgi:transposase
MNNSKLRQIKEEHGLTYRDIAEICDVSYWTVKSWLLQPESSNYRNMPGKQLDKFKNYGPIAGDDKCFTK